MHSDAISGHQWSSVTCEVLKGGVRPPGGHPPGGNQSQSPVKFSREGYVHQGARPLGARATSGWDSSR